MVVKDTAWVTGSGLYGYWLALAVLAAPWPMPGGRALADTFQVTKTLDTRDGKCDADCSLREAIIAANQHPGPDTVMVPAGKYLLQQVGQEDQAAAGDLDILDDLTLIGAGAESTLIDGNQIDRVFEIHSPAVVRLSGLTIQNGSNGSGGGIYNQTGGTLTLENCTLSGNSASTDGHGRQRRRDLQPSGRHADVGELHAERQLGQRLRRQRRRDLQPSGRHADAGRTAR